MSDPRLPQAPQVGVTRTPSFSDGLGATAAEARNAWSTLGEAAGRLRAQMEPEAQRRAAEAGRAAVQRGDYDRPAPVFTGADRAYNQAAEATYLAEAQISARTSVSQLATSHRDNVEEFQARAREAAEAAMAEAPPALHGALEDVWGQEIVYATDNVAKSAAGIIERRARETQLANLEQLSDRVDAYIASDQILSDSGQHAIEQWEAAYRAFHNNPIYGDSPEAVRMAVVRQRDSWALRASEREIERMYQRRGVEAALDLADRVASDPNFNISPRDREAFRTSSRTIVNRMEARRRAKDAEAKRRIDAAEDALGIVFDPLSRSVSAGVTANSSDIADLMSAAQTVDEARVRTGLPPVHAERVARLFEHNEFRQAAAKLPPNELRRQIVDRQSAVSDDPERTVAEIDALETVLDQTEKAWANDPYGTAVALEIAPEVPLDFSTPESIAESWRERLSVVGEAGEPNTLSGYLGADQPALRPEELRGLRQAMNDPQALVSIVSAMAEVDPYATVQELRRLTDDKSAAPMVYASVVMSTGGSFDAAAEVVEGVNLTREPGFKSAVNRRQSQSSTSAAEAFAKQTRGFFAMAPEESTALMEAAAARYEVYAQGRGLTAEGFDDNAFMDLIETTAGRQGAYGGFRNDRRIGGRQVLVPPRIARSKWDEVLKGLTLVDIADAGGAGAIYDMGFNRIDAGRLADMQWLSAGEPGVYHIAPRSGAHEGAPLLVQVGEAQDGGPAEAARLTIDLNAIMDRLSKRHGHEYVLPR